MLSKLTNLFYESEGGTKDKKQAPTPVVPTIPVVPSTPTIQALTSSQPDPDMLKILEEAINTSNLPGFDYLEFRDVLANMAALGLTEGQQYKAAFAAAQAAKVTKAQLVDSIDQYLRLIEAKAAEFASYVNSLQASSIAGKDKKIEDLRKLDEADRAEIARRNSLIEARTKEVTTLQAEINQATSLIQAKTVAFQTTQAAIVGKLTEDKSKILTHITG